MLWGNGPTAIELIDSIRERGPVTDAHLRQRIAAVYTEHTVLDLIRLRMLTATLKGQQPGAEASIRKLMADEHGQHVMTLARDCVGAAAMLTGGDGDGAIAERQSEKPRPRQASGRPATSRAGTTAFCSVRR